MESVKNSIAEPETARCWTLRVEQALVDVALMGSAVGRLGHLGRAICHAELEGMDEFGGT